MIITKKVREFVEEVCKDDKWILNNHIYMVVEHAKQLARKLHADEEIVEISAWLHDIGRYLGTIEDRNENHHVSGRIEAEKILVKLGYPQDKIEKVKHCIYAHRASCTIKRETPEAECVASADAMAHFDIVVKLLYSAFVKRGLDEDEGKKQVLAKLERTWNKMIPEAKEIVKEKYNAAKLLLS